MEMALKQMEGGAAESMVYRSALEKCLCALVDVWQPAQEGEK